MDTCDPRGPTMLQLLNAVSTTVLLHSTSQPMAEKYALMTDKQIT